MAVSTNLIGESVAITHLTLAQIATSINASSETNNVSFQASLLPWDQVRAHLEKDGIIDTLGKPLQKAYQVHVPSWSPIQIDGMMETLASCYFVQHKQVCVGGVLRYTQIANPQYFSNTDRVLSKGGYLHVVHKMGEADYYTRFAEALSPGISDAINIPSLFYGEPASAPDKDWVIEAKKADAAGRYQIANSAIQFNAMVIFGNYPSCEDFKDVKREIVKNYLDIHPRDNRSDPPNHFFVLSLGSIPDTIHDIVIKTELQRSHLFDATAVNVQPILDKLDHRGSRWFGEPTVVEKAHNLNASALNLKKVNKTSLRIEPEGQDGDLHASLLTRLTKCRQIQQPGTCGKKGFARQIFDSTRGIQLSDSSQYGELYQAFLDSCHDDIKQNPFTLSRELAATLVDAIQKHAIQPHPLDYLYVTLSCIQQIRDPLVQKLIWKQLYFGFSEIQDQKSGFGLYFQLAKFTEWQEAFICIKFSALLSLLESLNGRRWHELDAAITKIGNAPAVAIMADTTTTKLYLLLPLSQVLSLSQLEKEYCKPNSEATIAKWNAIFEKSLDSIFSLPVLFDVESFQLAPQIPAISTLFHDFATQLMEIVQRQHVNTLGLICYIFLMRVHACKPCNHIRDILIIHFLDCWPLVPSQHKASFSLCFQKILQNGSKLNFNGLNTCKRKVEIYTYFLIQFTENSSLQPLSIHWKKHLLSLLIADRVTVSRAIFQKNTISLPYLLILLSVVRPHLEFVEKKHFWKEFLAKASQSKFLDKLTISKIVKKWQEDQIQEKELIESLLALINKFNHSELLLKLQMIYGLTSHLGSTIKTNEHVKKSLEHLINEGELIEAYAYIKRKHLSFSQGDLDQIALNMRIQALLQRDSAFFFNAFPTKLTVDSETLQWQALKTVLTSYDKRIHAQHWNFLNDHIVTQLFTQADIHTEPFRSIFQQLCMKAAALANTTPITLIKFLTLYLDILKQSGKKTDMQSFFQFLQDLSRSAMRISFIKKEIEMFIKVQFEQIISMLNIVTDPKERISYSTMISFYVGKKELSSFLPLIDNAVCALPSVDRQTACDVHTIYKDFNLKEISEKAFERLLNCYYDHQLFDLYSVWLAKLFQHSNLKVSQLETIQNAFSATDTFIAKNQDELKSHLNGLSSLFSANKTLISGQNLWMELYRLLSNRHFYELASVALLHEIENNPTPDISLLNDEFDQLIHKMSKESLNLKDVHVCLSLAEKLAFKSSTTMLNFFKLVQNRASTLWNILAPYLNSPILQENEDERIELITIAVKNLTDERIISRLIQKNSEFFIAENKESSLHRVRLYSLLMQEAVVKLGFVYDSSLYKAGANNLNGCALSPKRTSQVESIRRIMQDIIDISKDAWSQFVLDCGTEFKFKSMVLDKLCAEYKLDYFFLIWRYTNVFNPTEEWYDKFNTMYLILSVYYNSGLFFSEQTRIANDITNILIKTERNIHAIQSIRMIFKMTSLFEPLLKSLTKENCKPGILELAYRLLVIPLQELIYLKNHYQPIGIHKNEYYQGSSDIYYTLFPSLRAHASWLVSNSELLSIKNRLNLAKTLLQHYKWGSPLAIIAIRLIYSVLKNKVEGKITGCVSDWIQLIEFRLMNKAKKAGEILRSSQMTDLLELIKSNHSKLGISVHKIKSWKRTISNCITNTVAASHPACQTTLFDTFYERFC